MFLVGGVMYSRDSFMLIYGNHYKGILMSPKNQKIDVAIFSVDV